MHVPSFYFGSSAQPHTLQSDGDVVYFLGIFQCKNKFKIPPVIEYCKCLQSGLFFFFVVLGEFNVASNFILYVLIS